MKVFYIGIGFFAVALGFLIGASNAPILGAIIAGILAFGTSAWSLFKRDPQKSSPVGITKTLGSVLIIFSLALIIGVFSGEGYRRNWFKKEKSELFWSGLDNPKSIHEALDWLMVERKLRALHYSNEQVKSLYRIYNDIDSIRYDIKHPYHIMLSNEELVLLLKEENPFGPSSWFESMIKDNYFENSGGFQQ